MAGEDRGEYRSIFVALVNGPEFLALSGIARALFYPVKLTLSALGIGAVHAAVHQFAEKTGFDVPSIEAARDELIRTNWLKVEGNVWWLIRGLEFEPGLHLGDIKHRKYVVAQWSQLPNIGLRNEFRLKYADWFQDFPSLSEDPSKTQASTETETDTKTETETETDPASIRPAVAVVVAANAALRSNPRIGAALRELHPGQAEEYVPTWIKDGIPLPLIIATVERLCASYQPKVGNTQPKGFKYFDAAVREAFARTGTSDINPASAEAPKKVKRLA